jgi:hypothetical protein
MILIYKVHFNWTLFQLLHVINITVIEVVNFMAKLKFDLLSNCTDMLQKNEVKADLTFLTQFCNL